MRKGLARVYGGSLEHAFSNYSGVGATPMAPYDLNAPGAVSEIKATLQRLAQLGSSPFGQAEADVIRETTWQRLVPGDVWDEAAGEEYLLAISRHRGFGVQIPAPYAQLGPASGLPQPTVSGLEILAGAGRAKLGGLVQMPLYEAWRATGCTLQATCMAPPSRISMPDPSTPVTVTEEIGPRLVPPPSAPAALLEVVKAQDAVEAGLWQTAVVLTKESDRTTTAELMRVARASRNTAAEQAIAAAPPRSGTTVEENVTACLAAGGRWDTARGCIPAAPSPPSEASTGVDTTAALVAVGAIGLLVLAWRRSS